MPKTNKERLQDNNIELQNIKTGIDNLPEYQDIQPIYATTDYMNNYNIVNSSMYAITTKGDYTVIVENTSLKVYKRNELLVTISGIAGTGGYYIVPFIFEFDEDTNTLYVGNTTNTYRSYTVYRTNYIYIHAVDVVNKTYLSKYKTYNVNSTYGDIDTSRSFSSNQSGGGAFYDNSIINIRQWGANGNYRWVVYKWDTTNKTLREALSYITTSNAYSYTVVAPRYIISTSNSYAYFGYLGDDGTGNYNLVKASKTYNGKTVRGVSYDGTKIFIGNDIYELNGVGIGNLIKENGCPGTNYTFAINDTYYLIENTLYKYNNETNTLDYIGDGYKLTSSGELFTQTNSTITIMTFKKNLSKQIGIIFNGDNYYFNTISNVTNSNVINGYTIRLYNGENITGSMPDNGTLNYTPSTSQQTIPAGYTSGGTISAVTSAIDQNIQAENIKKDITVLRSYRNL